MAATPQLHFGAGKISALPSLIRHRGRKVLLVTGSSSFTGSPAGEKLHTDLRTSSIAVEYYAVAQEPTPAMIDDAIRLFGDAHIDIVVAIGGGSALDAGKAVSAMLPVKGSVKDYLEKVGNQVHSGVKIPFIAVPTTAGTGSEATKNAVLSETGVNGFKNSLRHDNFVPDVAVIDPELASSCPPHVTASSGMDAFTQLLESYLSTNANYLTDSLCVRGLKLVSGSLPGAYHDGSVRYRSGMALAAYLSGITLANAGLGLVHGFASSIGGTFPIAHGVICSSLMFAANRVTVEKLRSTKSNEAALMKYAMAGKIFSEKENQSSDYYIDSFLDVIRLWRHELNIPSLAQAGMPSSAISDIAGKTDNKYNPVKLSADEIATVIALAMT